MNVCGCGLAQERQDWDLYLILVCYHDQVASPTKLDDYLQDSVETEKFIWISFSPIDPIVFSKALQMFVDQH